MACMSEPDSLLPRPPAGGLRGVLDRVRALRAAGAPHALALVVHTEGSTYRKRGALAVVAHDGSQAGVISGGCLEPELVARAQAAIAAARLELVTFDTQAEADALFGSGSGCRGLMRVAVVPSTHPAGPQLGDALLAAESAGLAHAVTFPLAGDAEAAAAAWPATVVPRSPRLVLFGAGPEAAPLTRIARELGWFAAVVDHRPARTADAALLADAVLTARPQAAAIPFPHYDAALVMTHVASADFEALQRLAATPDVGYLGLLGPPARREALLAMLDAAARDSVLARLRAPAGLPIGGEGPHAIALSIAAGLQQYFHGLR